MGVCIECGAPAVTYDILFRPDRPDLLDLERPLCEYHSLAHCADCARPVDSLHWLVTGGPMRCLACEAKRWGDD